MIRHIIRLMDRIRGQFAHRGVDKDIGQFAKAADRLNKRAFHLSLELATNAERRSEIEARDAAVRAQRDRANKVKKRLQEFVA